MRILLKPKRKQLRQNLFCWFSAKSDSRAEREILNILEDNDIAVGRGADYHYLSAPTGFVVDDLPEESTLDDTWCDRYELAEDQQTWQLKQKPDHENQETSCQQNLKLPVPMYPPAMHQRCSAPYLACACLSD